MKKGIQAVLSVGASIEHVESIKIAKQMGYRVIAVDGNQDSIGFQYADVSINIDLKNEREIIQIAKEYNIQGVIPAPIGKLLTTVGAVNDTLRLKGISREAAVNCVDKAQFNKALKKSHIQDCEQIIAKSEAEILEGIKKIGTPCILKPRFGSGSKAVRFIANENKIECFVKEHLNLVDDDETLIEEVVIGDEYGIDGAMVNNEFKLVLIRKKQLTPFPYRQEIAYECPAYINDELKKNLYNHILRVCHCLKINNCLLHADVIINRKKIYIIEISGRPAGYFIAKKVVPYVTKINFLREGVKLALGQSCTFIPSTNRILLIHFLDFIEGKVIQKPSNKQLEELDFVYESNIQVNVGETLDCIRVGSDIYKRGYLLIKGKNVEEAKKNLALIKRMIIVRKNTGE